MKKINNKFLSLLLAMLLIGASAIPAYAADTTINQPETQVEQTSIESRVSYTDSINWRYTDTSATVTLTRDLRANSSQKVYTGVPRQGSSASSGTVNLKFKNNSTGQSYVLSFYCNGAQQRDTLGVTLPAGTYTVTQVVVTSGFSLNQIICSFVF